MSDWNLMPGAGWTLAQQERAHDAYDAALSTAWESLADEAPDGVGWEVTSDEQDAQGRFVITFRDGGGYKHCSRVDPWGDDDDGPPSWWD
jgi:hypothetical protein